MKVWQTHARRGPVRALIAVCLLAGVFAMHGLTGNHDAAMALTHQMPATPANPTTQPATHQAPSQSAHRAAVHQVTAGNESAAAAPSSHSAPTHTEAPVRTAIESGSDGHLHAIGDVCLAMLTALALAMIAALGARGLLAAYAVALPGLVLPSIARGPSPPWLRPTLSKLCVLRT